MKTIASLCFFLLSLSAFPQGFTGVVRDFPMVPGSVLDLKALFDLKGIQADLKINALHFFVECSRNVEKMSFKVQLGSESFTPEVDCRPEDQEKMVSLSFKKRSYSELKTFKMTATTSFRHSRTELLYDFNYEGSISGKQYKKELAALEKLTRTALDLDRGYTVYEEGIIRLQAARELKMYPSAKALMILKDCMNHEGKYKDYDLIFYSKAAFKEVLLLMSEHFSEEEISQAMLDVYRDHARNEEIIMMIEHARTFRTAGAYWFAFHLELPNYYEYFSEVLQKPAFDEMLSKYLKPSLEETFSEFNTSTVLLRNLCLGLKAFPQHGTFSALLVNQMQTSDSNFECGDALLATITSLQIPQELLLLKVELKTIMTKTGMAWYSSLPVMYHERLVDIGIHALFQLHDEESIMILREAALNTAMDKDSVTLIKKLLNE